MIGSRAALRKRGALGLLVVTAALVRLPLVAAALVRVGFDDPMKDGVPAGWRPHTFRHRRPTIYERREVDGEPAMVAISRDSASALLHPVVPKEVAAAQWVSWRWKIEQGLANASEGTRDGDDYAARVFLLFGRRRGVGHFLLHLFKPGSADQLPMAGLNYVWSSSVEVGRMFQSPYVGDVAMVVLERGAVRAGEWVTEQRDFRADYRAAFGTEPPPLVGIGIMTDTDDTHASARAWYGTFTFENGAVPPPPVGSAQARQHRSISPPRRAN